MKKIIILLLSMLCITESGAQDSIYVKGKILRGKEVQPGCRLFQDDEDTLVTVNYRKYIALYKKARLAELNAERLDSIRKAQEKLIASYENYEAKADSHIVVQEKMIETADKLYNGYKKMYSDLKTLYDVRPFCIVAGTGLYSYDKNGLKPVFNIGVEYKKFQVSGLFGKLYGGINLQYRLALF